MSIFASRAALAGILGLSLALTASGCAHAPVEREDPRILASQACGPGSTVKSSKGSVWLKAQSKEASGQFPANVLVTAPDRLHLEVTNLIGGTEATIAVTGQHYMVQVPKHRERSEQGDKSWGGIPLQWATDLFLGRIPCPSSAVLKDSRASLTPDGDLSIETPSSRGTGERFVFHFRKWEGNPWPETLHWERLTASARPLSVDFKFDDPEEKTRSPRKWEAKSSQGEVKVRWRDREYEMSR